MHVKETGNTKHPVVKKLFVNHKIPKNNTGIVLKITVFNFTFLYKESEKYKSRLV